MNTDKEKVEKIEEEQLDKVQGGFLGTLAVIGIATLFGGVLVGTSCAASAAKKK